ncbi:MAG: hypothetical protein NZ703_14825, partial [Gemmataceae bacterium]|nr:hypothetical protein [Gemmataceae bacterium]
HRHTSSRFWLACRNFLTHWWPLCAIGGGSLLAVLSLVLHLQEWKTLSMPLFLVGALIILIGLIGLVHAVLRPSEANDVFTSAIPEDDQPRPLNIYRRHDCSITVERLNQFAEAEKSLIEMLKEQNVPVDWDAYARLATPADGDLLQAFRLRCEALLLLADAYHKALHKQESFQPSWTSPTRN